MEVGGEPAEGTEVPSVEACQRTRKNEQSQRGVRQGRGWGGR